MCTKKCQSNDSHTHLKNSTLFFGYESLSKGYNVLNEFVSVSHKILSHAMVGDKVL